MGTNKPGYAKKYYNTVRKYEERFQLVNDFGSQCVVCGETFNPAQIDFHHLPPFVKLFGVNKSNCTAVQFWDLVEEMQKCTPVCANCHRLERYTDEIDPGYLFANRITWKDIQTWLKNNAASVEKT